MKVVIKGQDEPNVTFSDITIGDAFWRTPTGVAELWYKYDFQGMDNVFGVCLNDGIARNIPRGERVTPVPSAIVHVEGAER